MGQLAEEDFGVEVDGDVLLHKRNHPPFDYFLKTHIAVGVITIYLQKLIHFFVILRHLEDA